MRGVKAYAGVEVKEVKAAHHCYSVGVQQLLRGHRGEVGDVGQGVDEGHQWDRDVDGPGKVPGGGAGTRHFWLHKYELFRIFLDC